MRYEPSKIGRVFLFLYFIVVVASFRQGMKSCNE